MLFERINFTTKSTKDNKKDKFSQQNISCISFAAHRAAYLAGESPVAAIGCMPNSYNRRLSGVTRQAEARS
jgi:hypothetical protein